MHKTCFLLSLSILAIIASACVGSEKREDYYTPNILATHFNGEHYVGAETCITCHTDIHASHVQTAHFNTSAWANSENIKGSFSSGSNTLKLKELEIEMVKDGDSFYQHTKDHNADLPIPPEKIDIVIGSGLKGQSYLTWENEKLFQLQASYYPPVDIWVNSPGYPSTRLRRPIRDGCLKCHVSFATNRDFSGVGNQYDKSKMLLGVDCEKCHRPAAKHVIFHRKNPDVKEAKFMLKLDTLSRQKRLDVCAQCHSGLRSNLIKGNSFSFLSGENLKEYSRNFYTGQAEEELDVHGNQYGLLTSSECFKQSLEMDCSTCHDPHKNQRGNLSFFNQKCMSCHNSNSVICSLQPEKKQAMGNDCVACHMPNTPSKLMSIQLTKDSLVSPVYVRSHLIKVYLEKLYEAE